MDFDRSVPEIVGANIIRPRKLCNLGGRRISAPTHRKNFMLFLCVICTLLVGCANDTPAAVYDHRIFHEVPALMSMSGGIDLDITAMDLSTAYSTLIDISMMPQDYIGQTIKMRGTYFIWHFGLSGLYYHQISFRGPGGCCPRALEFILRNDGEYPEVGAKIEIIGVIGSYEEFGGIFHYIAVDYITVLE